MSDFPIAALGASAGGLEALEEFFANAPSDSGIGFVVVTHQHPKTPSMLPELLGKVTSMPVCSAADGLTIEPDHVYISPADHYLGIFEGKLALVPVGDSERIRTPIDYFFRSLARDRKELAIGIVLSGTGSDGTLGIKEIKGASGMAMVQEESSAKYGGMPHSALATGLVDYVRPVADLPEQLAFYVSGPYLTRRRIEGEQEDPRDDGSLRQIFLLLRDHTGHDFSGYKQSTIRRRIERRMNVHQLHERNRYVRYLRTHPGEIDLLFKELLIGVTSFFRDSDAFEALAAKALPQLIDAGDQRDGLRVWVPGCSTGEEAYSLAILLCEVMKQRSEHIPVQVFATDLDNGAIDTARAGRYPTTIAADVTRERLDRWFVHEDDAFRVRKEIRELVVFAPQNVIDDPPFTRVDLLSCRNLLIYLDASLQQRLLPLFHYALRPGGVLFLGSSESIGAFDDLFAPIDKKWKIFSRKNTGAGAYVVDFPSTLRNATLGADTEAAARQIPGRHAGIDRDAEKLLMRELVPPSVLIHERGEIVHIHGRTGQFLEPAPGLQTSANIYDMARDGLPLGLASALREASSTQSTVFRHGVRVKANGKHVTIDLRVIPVTEPQRLRGLYLVSFISVPQSGERSIEVTSEDGRRDRDIAELERQLRHTRESHSSTIEELETANEELKSTNEELQSTNEELQSTNEELETSQEELQSLNEELQTVNAELESKVDELSRANDDMKNLLNSTDIATVFLDNDLCVKRFTTRARQVINLIPSDIGRPISDLVSRLRYDSLTEDASDVLRTLATKEIEVRGDGENPRYYLMRIVPYRTTENIIDGLVITFVDTTRVRKLKAATEEFRRFLGQSPTTIYTQDRELRFTVALAPVFGRAPEELVGLTDRDIMPEDDAERFGELKRRVLESGQPVRERIELSHRNAPEVPERYDVYIEPVTVDDGEPTGVTCVMTGVSARGEET